ncbi:C39 family peptidase [Mumia sp. zg.B53]|uniref:C39 family peptidase n=1 Tax=unclassified Mumia TaxID=2621872 RepID=UPI001C6E85BC|nr:MULTISPECIES: C39 family peptidase [unclassified Mumia]MBW9216331.1 C39 family peptidase [Mumia sp. zg.B53]MDD9347983.1 C39 family peptidase [Mumia sp.]
MFRQTAIGIASLATIAAVTAPVAPVNATSEPTVASPQITAKHWDSVRDFARGTWEGVIPALDGSLVISPRSKRTTTYADPFAAGTEKSYVYGRWTSPVVTPGYAIDESITSWNARTPTGTFVETTFRGKLPDGTWTKWYVMGRWASGDDFAAGDIHRTSVDGQGDANANIWTDTFSARTGREPVAYQTRVTLLRPEGTRKSPRLDGVTTMTNELLAGDDGVTSDFTLGRHVELPVPRFSQNIHKGEYPEFGGGGQVWCSPTSTTMVQYYWGKRYQVPRRELADIVAPNGDPQVDYAAIKTWDYTYEGAGNWPFNAAYAHTFGLDTFVTRLRSLAEAERLVAAGIPVITSLSWDLDEMPEAGYETNGHLMVLIGFTADGDPILNDPASSSNEAVRNVYTRENFEKVWQDSTGGVSYLYRPPGKRLPGGATNW